MAAVPLLVAALALGGCPGQVQWPRPDPDAPTYEARGAITVGRVVDVDMRLEVLWVEFPWGLMFLSSTSRELQRLRPGELVYFDRQLQPVWGPRPPVEDLAPAAAPRPADDR